MVCIYRLTNIINGKVYIGLTTNIDRRKKYYNNPKRQRPIEKAIQKFGIDNFKFDVIYTSENLENGLKMERTLITEYDSIKNGYNVCPGGQDGTLTEEYKIRISNKLKGRKFSKEWHRKQSESQLRRCRLGRSFWNKGMDPEKIPYSKLWLAISPSGEKIYMKSIRAICIKYELNYRTLVHTLNTKNPVKQSWKYINMIGWQLLRAP